jgi:mycothiol S-conjugate amidase
MTHKPTLLGIFAHPDDESFGPGGTLARYAAEGKAVHVIIATDGIAGSVEDVASINGHDTLAQARSLELSNAAVALGVTSIWSLPYRDSGMRGSPDNDHPDALIRQPLEQTIEEVFGYFRRLRPHVVVTHDPFGGYGHPDHIRVCEATTAAFHLARRHFEHQDGYQGPQKLYYTAFDKRLLKVMVRLMPLWGQDPTALGRNKDINLVEISRWHTPVHTRVNVAAYLPRKLAASRAHVSQYSGGPSYIRILPKALRQRFLETESYTRAYPAPTAEVEHDLFSGVV